MKPKLVVSKPVQPLRIVVTADRAARMYPDSPLLQAKWLDACTWMQDRRISLWVMDREAKRPDWNVEKP
jgi:hypothetical protein